MARMGCLLILIGLAVPFLGFAFILLLALLDVNPG